MLLKSTETRDFRKTNSIMPRFSKFSNFRVDSVCAKTQSAIKSFPVGSAHDEICSAYAEHILNEVEMGL
jgi:hypothetical protein